MRWSCDGRQKRITYMSMPRSTFSPFSIIVISRFNVSAFDLSSPAECSQRCDNSTANDSAHLSPAQSSIAYR